MVIHCYVETVSTHCFIKHKTGKVEMKKICLLFIVFIFGCTLANADITKCSNSSGRVWYYDSNDENDKKEIQTWINKGLSCIGIIKSPSKQQISNKQNLKLTKKTKNKKPNKNTPIEDDAAIYNGMKNNYPLLESLANAVRLYGYTCDSISAAKPFIMSRGFTLVCNNFAYEYNIEDKGGNMSITVE